MKKKFTTLLLISAMLLSLSACAGNKEEAENDLISSEPAASAVGETSENTVSDSATAATKKNNDVSITSNPMDDEYFVPATNDWFLFSQNGCFVDLEELETDCVETQILYSFQPDGSLAAQAYKLIYKNPEAAQAAYDFMPDYPYTPEAYSSEIDDNVLYFETGVLTYDKKSRFIERMQDDSCVEDLGNGIYGYVMGSGTVWAKYQFSKLDTDALKNGALSSGSENSDGGASISGDASPSSGENTQSGDTGAQIQASPWIGVWECDNGDVFIGKYSQSIDYKYDMFYYDSSVGAGWQIRVSAEEENGNNIESYMIDPDFDYDAAYYITLDTNTLTYTETFHDSPTEYTDMVFTKTGRTDVDEAWSEYWNQ